MVIQKVLGLHKTQHTAFHGYNTNSYNIICCCAAPYEEDGVVSSLAVCYIGLCYINYISFVSFWGEFFALHYGSQA